MCRRWRGSQGRSGRSHRMLSRSRLHFWSGVVLNGHRRPGDSAPRNRHSQSKSGPRKITRNPSPDVATFTWTGHRRSGPAGAGQAERAGLVDEAERGRTRRSGPGGADQARRGRTGPFRAGPALPPPCFAPVLRAPRHICDGFAPRMCSSRHQLPAPPAQLWRDGAAGSGSTSRGHEPDS